MKIIYLITVISLTLTGSFVSANAQNTWGSLEVVGSIGFSNAPKSYQEERMENDERISMANALNYSNRFSPGLYASGELRFLLNLNGLKLGPYLSYYQLQIKRISTRSIEESFGLQSMIFNSEYTEYIFSFGGVAQFQIINLGDHQLQPVMTFGLNSVYARRLEVNQEIRYLLSEYSTSHQTKELNRQENFLKEFKYSDVSIGLNYSYRIGKLNPFCELGYRFLNQVESVFSSGHDWNVFFGKVGLKLLFNKP